MIARVAELGTEVGVAGRDDTADQRSVVFVVQKRDDLLGDVAPASGSGPLGPAPAIGRQDQHIGFLDLDGALRATIPERDPDGGQAQLLDKRWVFSETLEK